MYPSQQQGPQWPQQPQQPQQLPAYGHPGPYRPPMPPPPPPVKKRHPVKILAIILSIIAAVVAVMIVAAENATPDFTRGQGQTVCALLIGGRSVDQVAETVAGRYGWTKTEAKNVAEEMRSRGCGVSP